MSRTVLWFDSALLPDGWADSVRLTLADGRIESVERGVAAAPGEARHAIGLPGLPNLHSHAFQRAMAGLAERRGPDTGGGEDSFWTWRTAMYRFVDRMQPDDVEAIAAQAFAEMLESGFTRVGEFHYLHHDVDGRPYGDRAELAGRIAAAAAASGIALTLLPVFYAQGGFGAAPPQPGQRRFVTDPESYGRLLEGARRALAGLSDSVLGVAPHSLRAATPEQIRAVAPLAGGGPVHIHVAEQQREVDDCIAWSGRRPVELLLHEVAVDRRWCLVHATHVEPAEIAAVAAAGAAVGLCPITEANLGDGIFPARAFLAAGGVFGVGSDSNVRIDAAEELRLLEYGQRLATRTRNVLAGDDVPSTGGRLFRAALAGGGAALGAAGGLAPGRPADLVSLRADSPAFVGRRHDGWLDAWIFAGGRELVDGVWRAGRRVVAGGRHADRTAIEARYRAALRRLLAAD